MLKGRFASILGHLDDQGQLDDLLLLRWQQNFLRSLLPLDGCHLVQCLRGWDSRSLGQIRRQSPHIQRRLIQLGAILLGPMFWVQLPRCGRDLGGTRLVLVIVVQSVDVLVGRWAVFNHEAAANVATIHGLVLVHHRAFLLQ